MPRGQFASARFKLARAVRHIEEIQLEITKDAADTDTYRLLVEKNPKTGGDNVVVEFLKPLRPVYALCLGDAIHNMRASFDHIASDMARREGRDTARVHFPFEETRERLIQTVPYRAIERSHPDVAAAIADVIQPYKTANTPLWALNKADNVDKHRLLLATLNVSSIVGASLKDDCGSSIGSCTLTFDGEGRFCPLGFLGRVEITNYGKPTFDVLFAQGEFFERQSVIPTLHGIAECVASAILTLEGIYFRT